MYIPHHVDILKVAESDLADDNDELLEFCTMTGDQRVLRVLKLMEPEDIDQWYRDHVETKDWHDDLHEEASAAAQEASGVRFGDGGGSPRSRGRRKTPHYLNPACSLRVDDLL